MKKFELNVVNFDNEDVIATSCELTPIDIAFGREAGGKHHATVDVNVYGVGTKFVFDGTTYTVANNDGHLKDDADTGNYVLETFDGIYHYDEETNTYTYCEDGHND